ncbi:MAG: hypothetical protein GEU82_00420 [Luteitalea sp.]|nr:hypothetical protein [Luteitalea sp.]
MPEQSLKRNARTRIAELRKLFQGMVEAYSSSTDWRTRFSAVESQLTRIIGGGRGPGLEAPAAGASSSSAEPLAAQAAAGVQAAGGSLVAGSTQTTAGTQGAGGTQGAALVGAAAVVGEIGIKDLDPKIREQLRQFRLEVELFFASALTDSAGVSNTPGVPK